MVSTIFAQDRDYKVLRLDCQDLAAFPPELEQREDFDSISGLDLAHNKFREFPARITQFSHIKALFLTDNEIETLPPELGDMKQLEVLVLTSNKLKELPSFLFKLTNLKQLDVVGNQIQTVPPEVQNLPNLRFLRTGSSIASTVKPPVKSPQPSLKDRCIDSVLRKGLSPATLPQDLQETLQEDKRVCWGCNGSFSCKMEFTKRTPIEIAGKILDHVWASYCSEKCLEENEYSTRQWQAS